MTPEELELGHALAREDWTLFQVFARHFFGPQPVDWPEFANQIGVKKTTIYKLRKAVAARLQHLSSSRSVRDQFATSSRFPRPVSQPLDSTSLAAPVQFAPSSRSVRDEFAEPNSPVVLADSFPIIPRPMAGPDRIRVRDEKNLESSSKDTSITSTSTRLDATRYSPRASEVLTHWTKVILPVKHTNFNLDPIQELLEKGIPAETLHGAIRAYSAERRQAKPTWAYGPKKFFGEGLWEGYAMRDPQKPKKADRVPDEVAATLVLLQQQKNKGGSV
jgi:predicted DNA-binding transcriptional regulator AlpA